MLVLDRKLQEGFWINGRIFIKVLSIGRRRVKLGIEAPDDLEIVREELASPGAVGERPAPDAAAGPLRPTRPRT
jgi:carbon storage regulator